VLVDNEKNDFNNIFQAWPDRYFLIEKSGRVLARAEYSTREQAKVDIDCVWMIKFIKYVKDEE